jgi:hypothetical protein
MDRKKENLLRAEVLNILFENAQIYNEKLIDRNLVFIYEPRNPSSIETQFNAEYYLHLTGVEANDGIDALKFYSLCVSRQLKTTDFEIRLDGTTELKLSVLDRLLNIESAAKMLGDFNHTKPKLYTEKIVGNIYACMGFVMSGNSQFYVPNTALKEDVRDVVTKACQVVAIFSKAVNEPVYTKLVYKAKDFGLTMDKLPRSLRGRIRLSEEKSITDKLRSYSGEYEQPKPHTKDKGLER